MNTLQIAFYKAVRNKMAKNTKEVGKAFKSVYARVKIYEGEE
jgi:hypothetical protein